MKNRLYREFKDIFNNLLKKSGVSCYQISEYSLISQTYLSRLRRGVRRNPGPEVIMKIALGIKHYDKHRVINIDDIEQLFNSAGRTLRVWN